MSWELGNWKVPDSTRLKRPGERSMYEVMEVDGVKERVGFGQRKLKEY